MAKICDYLVTNYSIFNNFKMGCLFSKRSNREKYLCFDTDEYNKGEYPPETDKMGHNDVFYTDEEEKQVYDRYR